MRIIFTAVFCFILNTAGYRQAQAFADTVMLKKGMVITRSVTIGKSHYKFNASHALENSVVEIKGSNIVVDFNGAVLQGSNDVSRPDKFYGVAVHISGGNNITIRNAVIRGYKIALLGDNVVNLKIEHCDFSYNFRQHLNSTRQREDLSDWQSYHHNEKDEWMRFGAGMYLRDCDSMDIHANLITGGQCGLMMVRCHQSVIDNNNFSFNSGIGIGFYRSSYNRVFHNKLDWNVRGVSYGVYYRGQDAAAILVYEQSSYNVFAYNSATHSGDGFFLWAGASTLETGKGGCNDNLIYGNDFSYAPTNGIETTFSSNKIIRNKVYDCDYGVWAGYSHNTLIMGNDFQDNHTGIAIEQGQDNQITGNFFKGENTGVQLWAVPGRPKQERYDDNRDVRSMRYLLNENSFSSVGTALAIRHSQNLSIAHNHLAQTHEFIRLDSASGNISIRNNDTSIIFPENSKWGIEWAPEKTAGAGNTVMPPPSHQGKQYIMMTEWGPYDFRSPILWQTKKDSNEIHFDILGPEGTWKIKSLQGIDSLSATSGTVPGKLKAYVDRNKTIDIRLVYTGGPVVSPFGKKYAAGSAYPFGYEKFYIPITWMARLFSFNDANDPIHHPDDFKKLIDGSPPLRQITTDVMDNNLWNPSRDRLPAEKIATVAVGQAYFPKGRYVIGVSAGEMVRVYIDGKLVIDAWDPSKVIYDADYHHDAAVTLKGHHTIRIEQAQYGGYGMLYVTVKPEKQYDY
jgi:parallel beta-helix repeat protein